MKKLIALLLAVLMMLTLVACSKTGTDDDDEVKEWVAKEVDYYEEEGYPKDETLDHTSKYYQIWEGLTFTVIGSQDEGLLPEGQTYDYNESVWQWVAQTGMIPEFLWNVSGDAYTTKKNAAISSGEIPDLMSVSMTQYKELVKSGQIADLTDLIDEYMSPELKEAHMLGENAAALEALKVDGRIYGIPQVHLSGDGSPLVWIRKDWLEAVGLDTPTDLYGIEEVALAFMTQDPDGNGKDDTYGMPCLASYATSYGGNGNLGDFFLNIGDGTAPGLWQIQEDGTVIKGELMEGATKALTLLNDWYNKGIIPADFATWTGDDFTAAITNNQAGIVLSPWWGCAGGMANVINSDEDVEWIPLALGADGEWVTQGGGPVFNIFVVRKDFEYPEAFVCANNIRFASQSKVSTVSGTNFMNASVAPHGFFSSAIVSDMWINEEITTEEDYRQALIDNGVNGAETSVWWNVMDDIYNAAHAENIRDITPDEYVQYLQRYVAPKAMMEADPQFVYNAYQGTTESIDTYGSFLDELYKNEYTNMIMGNTNGLSIEEYFANFVQSYLDQGGADCQAEVQAEIDAR